MNSICKSNDKKYFYRYYIYMQIMPIKMFNQYKPVPQSKKTVTSRNPYATTLQTNRAFINFSGYYGDTQPIKKLYWLVSGKNVPDHDNWTDNHIWEYCNKRWINAYPAELLKRTPTETINSIMTLTGKRNIPSYIPSPNIRGNNWGRYANYIEINPRLIAKYENGRISDGLLQTMKIMTAIPPSSYTSSNCLILSQLYPSFNNDGTYNDETLYQTNLHVGISKNLTARNLDYKMGDDEQVKAFNDLAHLLGFKTGFRMPISSGQLRVKGEDFSWAKHEKSFIDACVWAAELGFDSIYFDSAKHIVNMDCYCGVGDVPNKAQMTYILRRIREQTGRNDLSFIGEKCDLNPEYAQIGFNAGTDWSNPHFKDSVSWESDKQVYNYNYATGPEVSNDNDYGEKTFESRLERMDGCLFQNPTKRIPTYMQLNDILPLSPYTNTHEAMMHVVKLNASDAWTECERHWDGILRNDNDARNYTRNVYKKFGEAMYL